jgi:hypothetical protein
MRRTGGVAVTWLCMGSSLAVPAAASGQQAASPSPHGSLPAELDCSACHTPRGWFQLTGRHDKVSCARCHLRLRFDEPQLDMAGCSSCHVDVHQGRMRGACVSCHNTTSFRDVAGLSVHARTSFLLTGAHLQVACESCHRDDRGGAYTALNTECVACHESEYASSEGIDHVAAGFSTACQDCHGTLAWGNWASFDHVSASGGFPLRGSHAGLICEACHVMPGLDPKFSASGPDDCYACHAQDYDRQHAGSGFPTDCTGCHRETRWGDATFADHDRVFPITSGAHRGQWDGCETCHTVPSDFRSFTCFNCHEHSQTRMDEKHREERGYAYDSNLCYSCHRNGRADD